MTAIPGIELSAVPSGTVCVECEVSRGWWVHLRRCTQCGHIGCCDTSPSQHASAHAAATGHPVIRSFEPGEVWFYDYQDGQFYESGGSAGPWGGGGGVEKIGRPSADYLAQFPNVLHPEGL